MKKIITLLFLLPFFSVAIANKTITAASTVLMVPPLGFKYDEETAKTNRYQKALTSPDLSQKVNQEFTQMVKRLRAQGIRVLIYRHSQYLPDAVFPNNWFSTHLNKANKTDIIVYPMLTPNRQKEVDPQALVSFLQQNGIKTGTITDMRQQKTGALESTGSMILDRQNKIIYASLSERTNKEMVYKEAALLGGYRPIVFTSYNHDNQAIYHTNVMMGLGHKFAVVCLECIKDDKERRELVDSLHKTHKKIIDISQDQVGHMCGNVLELVNDKKQPILVMSQQAFDHFTAKQRATMAKDDALLPMQLHYIETVGGGSARCMMAEVYSD